MIPLQTFPQTFILGVHAVVEFAGNDTDPTPVKVTVRGARSINAGTAQDLAHAALDGWSGHRGQYTVGEYVEVESDNDVAWTVVNNHAEVDLEPATIPELRKVLRAAGITAGDVALNTNSRGEVLAAAVNPATAVARDMARRVAQCLANGRYDVILRDRATVVRVNGRERRQ